MVVSPRHRLAFVLVAALGAAGGPEVCRGCGTQPPDLSAVKEGDDVRLTWTGALDPGDAWVVYGGDLRLLWSEGPAYVDVATTALAEWVGAGDATDDGDYYWRVRCEGPAGEGPWSEMAFKLRRYLWTGLSPVTGKVHSNVFYLSLPSRLGLPDLADTADANPCTPADGDGDGVVNADDLLCAWWTSGMGTLLLARSDLARCRFESRAILFEDFALEGTPGVVLAGDWTAPLVPGEALMAVPCAPDPEAMRLSNEAIVVGAHDASVAACAPLELPNCAGPWLELLNVPYHGVYREADELLCGVKGVDWTPGPWGDPDACPNGIFSGAPPRGSGALVSVVTYDTGDDGDPSNNQLIGRNVLYDPLFGVLTFGGRPWTLGPGDAALTMLTAGHTPTQFCPPHW
jgi:hypothetical protein